MIQGIALDTDGLAEFSLGGDRLAWTTPHALPVVQKSAPAEKPRDREIARHDDARRPQRDQRPVASRRLPGRLATPAHRRLA
jgi:hypothetical protein